MNEEEQRPYPIPWKRGEYGLEERWDDIESLLKKIRAIRGLAPRPGFEEPRLSHVEKDWDPYGKFIEATYFQFHHYQSPKPILLYIACIEELYGARDRAAPAGIGNRQRQTSHEGEDIPKELWGENQPETLPQEEWKLRRRYSFMRDRLDHRWGPAMTVVFALVNLGSCLLNIRALYNSYLANQLFRLCANLPRQDSGVASLYYGAALVHGYGGLRRDMYGGLEHLFKAASDGYGLQAYFVIGTVYEGGADDGQNRICSQPKEARFYYNQAKVAAGSWVDDISSIRAWLRSPWDVASLEQELSASVGERFSRSIAAQAFLFGAAVSLSGFVQPDHFAPLLAAIPVLGIALSFMFFVQVLESDLHSKTRLLPLRGMMEAKLDAYDKALTLLESQVGLRTRQPTRCPCCPWLTLFLCSRERPKDWTKDVDNQRKQFWDTKLRLDYLVAFSWISFLVTSLVSQGFIATWIALLTGEIRSRDADCGSWWHSTCQGSDSACLSESMRNLSCLEVSSASSAL